MKAINSISTLPHKNEVVEQKAINISTYHPALMSDAAHTHTHTTSTHYLYKLKHQQMHIYTPYCLNTISENKKRRANNIMTMHKIKKGVNFV